MDSLYSPKTEEKLQRHEELHRKKYQGLLSKKEEEEHKQLGFWRENMPLFMTLEERRLEKALQNAVNRHDEQLKEIL